MTDLRTLMDLATDRVDGPDLVHSALLTVHRTRTRRRRAVAAVATVVAVAGVVSVPRALDTADPGGEPAGTPTPSPTPTQEVQLPMIPDDARHAALDPETAEGLPHYSIDSLPTVLVPEGSSSSPGDREEPLVLARSDDDRLALEYGDRAWYGLQRPGSGGDLWDSALSRDGARVAVVGEGGLFWCDAVAVCPSWSRADVPAEVVAEDSRITWTQDSARLILTTVETGYEVDLDTGLLIELPFLAGDTAFDLAPDGRLVTRPAGAPTITEFDGTSGTPDGPPTPELGSLTYLSAFEDAVAVTRVTDDGDDGLLVLNRDDDLTVRAFLPINGDVRGMVERGELRPVQWLNKVTVLFSVLVDDVRSAGKQDVVHLVAWNTLTGDLGRVGGYPASADVSLRDLYPS